ncbi:MAG: carboxypeptidase regulatory-like domain-containing protein [Verrucomicrobiae bacterium]|nr:carboxypeptidase regulatory-like domain-containing protein [Verrucomicrobiae bacterium]
MNLPEWWMAVFGAVVRVSIEGAALILVVVALQRVLRNRLGPGWTFALWFVVLLRLSLPTLPASSLSWQRLTAWRTEERILVPARPVASEAVLPAAPAPGVAVVDVSDRERLRAPDPSALPRVYGADWLPIPADDSVARTGTGRFPWWMEWLSVLWGAVGAGLLVRHAVGAVLFRRCLRRCPAPEDEALGRLIERCRQEAGVRRPVEVRVHPDLDGPGLYGWFRPVLVLPARLVRELGADEWRHIFRHEFAHLRRRDTLWNAWVTLLTCIHWFNPAVRWAASRIRRDLEPACDALALRGADLDARRAYGATLLKLATVMPAGGASEPLLGIVERSNPLPRRLKMLVQARPTPRFASILGASLLGLLGVGALTRLPDAAPDGSSEAPYVRGVEAIDLGGHTDFPGDHLEPGVFHRQLDPPGMWWQIPRGRRTFLGVPFSISGLIRLAGTDATREEWYFRTAARGIAVGRAFGRLYLLHGTYYYADNGATIARIRLNYADGTVAELPVRYGHHTLNYWRQRYETPTRLSDPDSRIVWSGDGPNLAEYGNSVRLGLSALANPHPERTVRTIDLVSAGESAAFVVVGMAVGGAELPAAWREEAVVPAVEAPWTGMLRFRAVDGESGEPIAGMRLRLELAEDGVHCRVATIDTDEEGWAEVRYPEAPLKSIGLWANHDRYVPRLIQWTRRQHGDFPEEYVYRAEPGERIAGRIEDEQGQPVRNALVRIEGPPPNFAGDAKEFPFLTKIVAVSDIDGQWSSSVIPRELPAESIRLKVLHPEFAEPFRRTLRPAERRGAPIRIRLSGGRALLGSVVDSRQRPIRGATVRVRDRQSRRDVVGTRTDATGAFAMRIAGQPTDWLGLVEAPGFASRLVPIDAGRSPTVIEPIVLQPGVELTLDVQGPEGEPVSDAVIAATSMEGRWVLDARPETDLRGRAVWTHAPAFGTLLEVSRDGFVSSMVHRPSDVTHVTVTLSPIRELAGRVIDADDGRDVPHFRVRRGRREFDEDAVVWESSPIAIGREGRFQVIVSEPRPIALDGEGLFRIGAAPEVQPRYYRFDAPGYAPSDAFDEATLESRQEPIRLKAVPKVGIDEAVPDGAAADPGRSRETELPPDPPGDAPQRLDALPIEDVPDASAEARVAEPQGNGSGKEHADEYVVHAMGDLYVPVYRVNPHRISVSLRPRHPNESIARFAVTNAESLGILVWNVRVQVWDPDDVSEPVGWRTVARDYPSGSTAMVAPGTVEEFLVTAPDQSPWRVCILYSLELRESPDGVSGRRYGGRDHEKISNRIGEW